MSNTTRANKAIAREIKSRDALADLLAPGATIHTLTTHVSASGMTRDIVCMVSSPETGRVVNISYWVAGLLGHRESNRGVRVYGGGMDMGFDLVYNIGIVLYGDGYALEHHWL